MAVNGFDLTSPEKREYVGTGFNSAWLFPNALQCLNPYSKHANQQVQNIHKAL